MGAEESKSSQSSQIQASKRPRSRSQPQKVEGREKIPYSSYSVTPKDTSVSEIITMNVSSKSQTRAIDDSEIRILNQIPHFTPLIKSSLSVFPIYKPSQLDTLDPKQMILAFHTYSRELAKATSKAAKSQAIINKSLFDLEMKTSKMVQIVQHKHSEAKKAESDLTCISRILLQVNSIQFEIDDISSRLSRLNSFLPSKLRLPDPIPKPSEEDDTSKVEDHSHIASCGLSFPLSGSWAEQGMRPTMEDMHVAIDCLPAAIDPLLLPEGLHTSFYAIYDGHGGTQTSKIAATLLHKKLFEHPEFLQGNYREATADAYSATDEAILQQSNLDGWRSGSTAASCLLIGSRLFVANLGDSEIILGRRQQPLNPTEPLYAPIELTRPHKPTEASEKQRILRAGGAVFFGRVMGSLAVSRALGDPEFKVPLNDSKMDFVTSEPYQLEMSLQENDDFLVLACDGLWDVMSHSDTADFVGGMINATHSESLSPKKVSKALVRESLRRGTSDNVSVIVVFLNSHCINRS